MGSWMIKGMAISLAMTLVLELFLLYELCVFLYERGAIDRHHGTGSSGSGSTFIQKI